MKANQWLGLAPLLGVLACGATGQPANDPSESDGHEADLEAAEQLRPMEGEQTGEPDMAFLKDMAGRSAKQAAQCATADNEGPRTAATVHVTFLPIGRSGDVKVDPPHAGTAIGDCVDRAFRGVVATPFHGEPVVIEQTVSFEKGESKK